MTDAEKFLLEADVIISMLLARLEGGEDPVDDSRIEKWIEASREPIARILYESEGVLGASATTVKQ